MRISRVASIILAIFALMPISAAVEAELADGHGRASGSPGGRIALLSCEPAADRDQRLPLPKPGAYRLSDIRSSGADYLGRALKFGLEIKDTPDFLLTEFTVPGRGGEGERNVPGFIPNPDDRLEKASIELNFNRLFPSTGDLKSVYSTIAKHRKQFDLSVDPLATEQDPAAYFMRTRSRDWPKRLASGLTISFALSERPTPDPTSDLPERVRQRILAEDRYEETYSLKFDPLPLFNTGSHRSEAAQALTAYATTFKPRRDVRQGLQVLPLCATQHPSCLSEVSGLSGGKRWVAALLPVFEFKTVDQFDFLQYGSVFLRSFFVEQSLEVYTLTWDLSRVLDRQKERTATLDAIMAVEKLSAGPPRISRSSGVPVGENQVTYLRLKASAGVKPLAWSVVSSSCKDASPSNGIPVPGIELDGAVLAGYATPLQRCDFQIAVQDALGRVDRLSCVIK